MKKYIRKGEKTTKFKWKNKERMKHVQYMESSIGRMYLSFIFKKIIELLYKVCFLVADIYGYVQPYPKVMIG